ncbi:hypothetical protein SRABI70_00346 [Pseudomonas sp. Bi70]|nr:hypothetical protein SRABI70_00346 [Pseudomonas sp. Bi70]
MDADNTASEFITLLRDCYKDELWGENFFRLVIENRDMAAREQAILSVRTVTEKTMQTLLIELLNHPGFPIHFPSLGNSAF